MLLVELLDIYGTSCRKFIILLFIGKHIFL